MEQLTRFIHTTSPSLLSFPIPKVLLTMKTFSPTQRLITIKRSHARQPGANPSGWLVINKPQGVKNEKR